MHHSLSAVLHILHRCPVYSFSRANNQTNTPKLEAESRLKNYLSGNEKLVNLEHRIDVTGGREIYAEIIRQAENVDADLIVMGMHGKATLRDMFIGTTIERVIGKGVRPVLMVKDKPFGDYKKVLVGTDFSAGSSNAL